MKHRSRLNKSLFVIFAATSAFVFSLALTSLFYSSKSASALSATSFNAGRIIDDGVFYNKDSMNVSQIQDFLNRLIGTCDTWGTGPSEYGGGTRAQYAASQGWPGPPYACINNYHENPDTKETSYEKGGGAFTGGISAAQIIYNASQTYGINPQVILVLLKKESSGPLTADKWPLKSQYKYAMGYACPDSGPNFSANCSTEKSGFYKQVMLAAWQLKYYRDHPNDYRYAIGWNDIQYSPTPSCGTKRVYIENMATLSLYIYTPYTPNDGALQNYPGTAPCGAYGNRNFFMFFSDWFGSTYGNDFIPLEKPRWMQVKNDGTRKTYLFLGDKVGGSLAANQEIRFVDKIFIKDKWYLRTEFNQNDGGVYGIEQSELKEIPYESITPKWITLISDTNRSHPASRTSSGGDLVKGTSIKVVDRITVNGNIYYRTEFNKNNNQDVGIHSRFITDFEPIALEGQRYFCSTSVINKVNPLTDEVIETTDDGIFMINKKTLINGVWYYQSIQDNGTSNFLSSKDLSDSCYLSFENPRKMRLNKDVTRFNPFTNGSYDTLIKDTLVSLSTKIFINNEWYYRTANNTQNNIDAVIPASAFNEL